ncbi:MAG: PIG-L family deacetylase [Firmicutes bacterium]|nr:PIG-L family deacetylase [Bacillota bacterium]
MDRETLTLPGPVVTMRRRWMWAVALFSALFAALGPSWHMAPARPARASAGSPAEPPLGGRILVLAPHPDDEVLGAGGLIQEALRRGGQVWVAVATSGESSRSAAVRTFHTTDPSPADFSRLGLLRREESREATAVLGQPPSHLVFLGYADGSLTPMWLGTWDCRHPRVSGGTHADRSLLPDGFHPFVAYCAPNVLADLARLLRAVRPDTIVMPDLADHHPDHAGLAAYAWAAVLDYDASLPPGEKPPAVYGYLVHYPNWPAERGLHASEGERLPDVWLGAPARLVPLTLSPEEVRTKERALLRYRTQLDVSAPFLEAFVRSEEAFVVRPPVVTLDARWTVLGHLLPDPRLTLAARSPEPGRLELRLEGLRQPAAGETVSLYAWQVRPGGPYRRLVLRWTAAGVVGFADGRPYPVPVDWRAESDGIAWSFEAGAAPWQVAASLAERDRVLASSLWAPVAARTAAPASTGYARP